ncbi:cyclin-dependent kinase inhibitor 1-like [Phalaenopsis equestris]|uniref:cyclin-dependent kinase inhibitor 1-like n=1 Tax=Phalaenopsis equestris TaxID=78828 RepID=UPI0009E3DDEB|nr:cyclin-dependent kinase inhibitor 1-like [Phalaenopsis equestris]
MVKCMKRCRRFAKVEVMEVSKVVGMRTRARSLALAAAAEVRDSRSRKTARSVDQDVRMAHVKFRSRSLVMTHREQSKLVFNAKGRICGNGQQTSSRCSSSSSCEAVENVDILFPTVTVHEPCEEVACSSIREFERFRDRREIEQSSNQIIYSGELDSSAEGKSRRSLPEFRTPPAAEIEEFFTVVEKSLKHQFAARYNFDFDNEVPLEGRYEWVRANP